VRAALERRRVRLGDDRYDAAQEARDARAARAETVAGERGPRQGDDPAAQRGARAFETGGERT
jgi:hypothetical protein